MMISDMHGWPPVCIMRLVHFPLSKTLNHAYFYVLKNLVCNIKYLWTFYVMQWCTLVLPSCGLSASFDPV
jgi:hypothetical protein